MTLKEFIKSATERLTLIYPPRESRAISVRLVEHFCSLPAYEYIIEPDRELPPGSLKLIDKAIVEISSGRPLQYVLGYQEFLGRRFNVREGVLIPRPETAEMVKLILEKSDAYRQNPEGEDYTVRILDAACGSGCIGITLAANRANSFVYMCDLSDPALKISAENSVNIGISDKVRIIREDILAPDFCSKQIDPASLDLIVSNPPYVMESEKEQMRRNVLDYEPYEALFVPDSDPLLFYRAIAARASELLKPGGEIWFEINEKCGERVRKLLTGAGFKNVEIIKDLNNKERIIRAIWL
ncbi:MAG: peptide chain release factor N(5)-glutamine methyltransferase [Bacteroidales bacterium]|nr:peptide chain release factor N(5)-glutamine methyltransferase [Bacteroidales bacterium]MDD2425127.1 peptide chain release factor N(5)-glutamine methyltransferase [Bacteroidales bacterium]MDD3989452.1 peptide chain release factor N(5)-glutamine methyltransferase [Bacteroidales bacterium]MDD4638276.1 peptide chain release factor N(5)-glutamine methyltransferase [Bacteroidales bacterium]